MLPQLKESVLGSGHLDKKVASNTNKSEIPAADSTKLRWRPVFGRHPNSEAKSKIRTKEDLELGEKFSPNCCRTPDASGHGCKSIPHGIFHSLNAGYNYHITSTTTDWILING